MAPLNSEEQALLLPNSDSMHQGSSALEEGQGYGLAILAAVSLGHPSDFGNAL